MIETVRWEPVPLRQIVGENELPLPFIPHFKAVKSADSSSIHFLSENGTGYTLDIGMLFGIIIASFFL